MKKKRTTEKIIAGAVGFVMGMSFISHSVYAFEKKSPNQLAASFKNSVIENNVNLKQYDNLKKSHFIKEPEKTRVIKKGEMYELTGYSAASKSAVAEKAYQKRLMTDVTKTASLGGFGLGGGLSIPEAKITNKKLTPSSMDYTKTKLGPAAVGEDVYMNALKRTDAVMYDAVKNGKVDVSISNDPLIRNKVHTEYKESQDLNKAAAFTAFDKALLTSNIPPKIDYSKLTKKSFTISTKLSAPPPIKQYTFKNPAPTINEKALLNNFISGMDVESNRVVKKAYESFMQMQGGSK